MRAFRACLSLWLLAAGCCLAPGMGWSQGATLNDRDAALLEAFAALFLRLEDGHPSAPGAEPVTRTRTNDAVSFRDNGPRNRSDSQYERYVFTLKLMRPCAIRVEQAYRHTRDASGHYNRTDTFVYDFSKLRSFEFKMLRSPMGLIRIGGDKIVCSPGKADCSDDISLAVKFTGRLDGPQSDVESFAARRTRDADILRKHCPVRTR